MSAKPPSSAAPRRSVALRSLAIGLGLLVLAGAVHALAWHWLGGQMESGFRLWAQSRRDHGWRVRHEPPMRGGWPFHVSLTVPQLQVTIPGASEAESIAWTAPDVVLRVTPPFFERLVVDAARPQRLRIGEAEYPFAADRLDFSTPFEPGAAMRQMEIVAERLRVGTEQGPVELRSLRLRLEARRSATEAEPAVTLALAAHHIDLPAELSSQPAVAGLGRRIEALGLDGSLSGPITYGQFATRAEAWREGGGTLAVREFSLRWGPVRGATRMTLTLDESLQPMGAGMVHVTGAAEALQALAAAGALTREQSNGARLAVTLLSRRRDPSGPYQLELPLRLEDRRLSVGPVTLLRFTPIAWPAPPENPAEASDPSLPALR